MSERFQHLFGLLSQAVDHHFRFRGGKPFELIEQLHLLFLFLRMLLELTSFTVHLGLIDFPLGFCCEVCTTSHRKGGRNHRRKAAQQYKLAVDACRTCYATHNTECSTKTVIDSVDCLTDPTAGTDVPFFRLKDTFESALRKMRRRRLSHFLQHTAMRFLFELSFQHKFSVGVIVDSSHELVIKEVRIALSSFQHLHRGFR